MRASEAAVQWAIRMPNGDLYGQQKQTAKQTADIFEMFFGLPSPMRDMMGLTEPEPPQPVTPVIFDQRAAADHMCAELAKEAAKVGVVNWGGTVVQRLCTPFTSGDPTTEFATRVQDWLTQNGELS